MTLEETLAIADQFSEAYAKEHFSQLDSQRMAYLFRRNTRELQMVVRELWEELQQSQFQPAGFEVNFGSEGGLPAIALPGNRINAVLRGFVDRVDTWMHNGVSYYRVVDYKTGKKDFDYCDVFNGVGLQMLLYLFALQESGGEVVGNVPIPAGVQYFPARVPYVSADGRLEDSDLEKQRDKDRKRRGLLLKDGAVLQAMEPGEHPKRLCYSVKKDGTLDGDLADREQLRLLKDHAHIHAQFADIDREFWGGWWMKLPPAMWSRIPIPGARVIRRAASVPSARCAMRRAWRDGVIIKP